MAEITKSYESRDIEKKWYAAWLRAKAFAGRVEKGRESHSIVIPPPNVTGVLTMGHVLNNTIRDILIRRARLEEKSASWLPGTDHGASRPRQWWSASCASRRGRATTMAARNSWRRVWALRAGKKVGSSSGAAAAARRLVRLGPHGVHDGPGLFGAGAARVRGAVQARLYLHRGKRMVNWCPGTQTALSDEEVIKKPVNSTMYRVRYELVDRPGSFIEVKTTRPENDSGRRGDCGASGRSALRSVPRKKSVVRSGLRRKFRSWPITAVDKDFGSGALKITPAHDKTTDYEIALRHKLPVIDVLQPERPLNELAGLELAGKDCFVGRKLAAELLKAAGALVAEEPYANNVGYSERADVPIEPRLTEQWWLRYPKVEEAKAAVRDGHIHFYPERWSKVYLHWLENIQDWCISRQLWWGHRIPVWYRKGADRSDPTELACVGRRAPRTRKNWGQEDDVLDTWASSWLWPFATLGWPDAGGNGTRGFDYFYPTTTLVTGPDIIFFWVARRSWQQAWSWWKNRPLEIGSPRLEIPAKKPAPAAERPAATVSQCRLPVAAPTSISG